MNQNAGIALFCYIKSNKIPNQVQRVPDEAEADMVGQHIPHQIARFQDFGE